MKLKRHTINPVLCPDPSSHGEWLNVFNPPVVHHNGLFHMPCRAQGLDWLSRIGYAVSTDARGVEDPRVTALDGRFDMCYTAYGHAAGSRPPTHPSGGGILPMIARSSSLITWERLGPIVRGEDNKDPVLFPRKIHGRYAAFHRRRPNVWLAYSGDLLTWRDKDMAPIYGPRADGGLRKRGQQRLTDLDATRLAGHQSRLRCRPGLPLRGQSAGYQRSDLRVATAQRADLRP